jgi:hypothetical protein
MGGGGAAGGAAAATGRDADGSSSLAVAEKEFLQALHKLERERERGDASYLSV